MKTDVCRALLVLASVFISPVSHAQTAVSIEIYGIDGELAHNARLFLSLEAQKDHPLLSEGRIRRLHRRAPQEIASALHPYGYYRARVDARLEQSESGTWSAIYTVDPGERLRIAAIDLQISAPMSDEAEFVELIEEQSLQVGEGFSHVEYEDLKSSIARLAEETGYLRSTFREHRVEIDLIKYEARIFLVVDGGNRFRFGEIRIRQGALDPDLLRRYLTFERGEPYSLDKLIDLQQALNNSDYFQVVEVSPGDLTAGSDEVPVNVVLTPRKDHRYEFGLGYGTDTGARAGFGWLMPRVNEAGHKIDTGIRVSERGNRAFVNYRVPGDNPRTDQIVYTAGIYEEEFEETDSNLREVGMRFIHGRGEWRETLSLTYQQEEYVVADLDGTSELLIPGVAWSRTWGRDFINVLDGLRFDLSLAGASAEVASDIDFVQAVGGIKFITSFDRRNRLIARGGAGATETGDFAQLPASLRFYAGGSQTVRGYKYKSLGPTNDDGDVIGARFLLFGGLEFEHYFNDRWGMAVFIDAGNAIDNLDDDLEQGAGFGLRWKSPVGPVRVDIANALTADDQPWRLHVNIGPDL
jgi:translocation and assembly module TamA